MDGIKSQLNKSAKANAKKVARQMAAEPLEILKEIPKQVVGAPESKPEGGPKFQEGAEKELTPEEKAKKAAQSVRLKQALDAELADIKRKKEEEKGQRQEAEFATQVGSREDQAPNPLVEPIAKPKRGVFAGIRTKLTAFRKQRRMENRLPPSG